MYHDTFFTPSLHAGDVGVSAVRDHIGRDAARPRICIRSCGVMHEVSPVRAQFAYGRQLACSCDCEAGRRRRRRARYRLSPGLARCGDRGQAQAPRVAAELSIA